MGHVIKNKDINKEIRFVGKVARFLIPYFKESTFRKINKTGKKRVGRGPKDLSYEQVWIDRSDRQEKLRICVYQPKEKKTNTPGVLWIHGGGYCMEPPEQDEMFIRELIEASGCTVVAPDYCLALEHPYPAALNDCYSALVWMKEHATELGINENKLMVGGDSAGGGLTAAVCIYARDQGEVKVAFQMPLFGMMDDRMITKSMQNNDAPFWNTKSNEIGWKLYLGELYGTDNVPPYASPSRLKDYRNLPPAVTFVGTLDPFHDEVIEYMKDLKKAGVPATYMECEGCYHGFDILCRKSEVANRAHKFWIEEFKKACG